MTAFGLNDGMGLPPILALDLLSRGGAEDRSRIGHRRRIGMASGKDDRRPDLGDGVEVVGEIGRQVNAAVRVGIARQIADMQRDALPGELLHVRHRLAIGGRGVHLGLVEDGEHAGRRRMARLAGRDGRGADQDAVAIDEDELLRDRDDDGDRTFRRALRVPDELTRLETAEVAVEVRRTLGQR